MENYKEEYTIIKIKAINMKTVSRRKQFMKTVFLKKTKREPK